MPNKNIYLTADDLQWWDAATEIAKRRKVSVSKVIGSLLEDFVRNNSGAQEMGLPHGFKIPASMKDPGVAAREELANDFRANFLEWLKDRDLPS